MNKIDCIYWNKKKTALKCRIFGNNCYFPNCDSFRTKKDVKVKVEQWIKGKSEKQIKQEMRKIDRSDLFMELAYQCLEKFFLNE